MLNKILSNLKFNSDYLSLLKEYQVKQSKEKIIRGAGFLFIALAFIIQIFAFTPAASQTNAASSYNDIIPGGVTSKAQVLRYCNINYHDVSVIYGYYGVSCATISKASVVSLRSTEYNGNLWSVGHDPYDLPGETPVCINGTGPQCTNGFYLYWRYLHGWDAPGGHSTYTALKITALNGRTYFILFTCGNLVSIHFPHPYLPPLPPPIPPKPPTPPKICPYNGVLLYNNPLCKPCPTATSISDVVSCLVYSKSAANITEHIANANNTTAQPGDKIAYTLTVGNRGKAAFDGFVVQEDLSDVLDYANLDPGSGAKLSSQDILSWPAVDIKAGQTINKTFDVTVKNPLPQIAPGADNPEGYNNVMTNVYGNTINISVPTPPAVTVVNKVTTTLPNTGPGTSIFVVFIVTSIVGYFYYRSRLLSKEALIAETINSQGV